MKVNTKRIHVERARRGWTRTEMARHIREKRIQEEDLSPESIPTVSSIVSGISRVERGENAPVKLIKDIAEVLEIPMEEFIVDAA